MRLRRVNEGNGYIVLGLALVVEDIGNIIPGVSSCLSWRP